MIVAGNYKVNGFEGTAKPHRLLLHLLYNRSNNDADIMLIKVLQKDPLVSEGKIGINILPVVDGIFEQV